MVTEKTDYAALSRSLSPLAVARAFDAGVEQRDGKLWLLNPHRQDTRRNSFYVEVDTRHWRECTGDTSPRAKHRSYGADLVSLWAYLADCSMAYAADQIIDRLDDLRHDGSPVAATAPRTRHELVSPAPASTPIPVGRGLHHPQLGDPSHRHIYRDAVGRILGIRCRFELEDGSKEIRPLALERLPDGSTRWHWRGFGVHIYGLERIHHTGQPILVVEGEKKSDAAQRLLDSHAGVSASVRRPEHVFAVVSVAPAGAADSVDIRPLLDRPGPIYLWPDNDSPGQQWSRVLAERLAAQVVEIPSGIADGWDIGDAIDEGWDAERILSLIHAPKSSPPVDTVPDDGSVLVPPTSRPLPAFAPPEHPYARKPQVRHSKPLPMTGCPIISDWPITRSVGDKTTKLPCIENFSHMLHRHGVTVQHNMMTRCDEISFPENAKLQNIPKHLQFQTMAAELGNLMIKHGGLGKSAYEYIPRVAADNAYCPFVEYVSECYYHPGADNPQAFDRLVSTVTPIIDDGLWGIVLKRFLVSMCAVTFDERPSPDGSRAVAQFTPILCSVEEGLGKSTWLARLVPPSMFTGGARIDAHSKDSIDAATKTVLTELGEIESSFESAHGLASLMAAVTRNSDSYRKAYARDVVEYPRRTVFAGTTNRQHLLSPSHDHRRFPLIELAAIDCMHDIDMRAVWGWILRLYRAGEPWWFSSEERERVAERNAMHRRESPVTLRILALLDLSATEQSQYHWCSILDIAHALQLDLSDDRAVAAVGPALTRITADIRKGVLGACETARTLCQGQMHRRSKQRYWLLPVLPGHAPRIAASMS